jgi:SAM-dependent methyltransferase
VNLKYVLARQPIPEFEDYSKSHIGAGENYHKAFREKPGPALMWELEKGLLRQLLVDLGPGSILDFACGTGRISSHVEKCAPAARIVGIDISESMLRLARENATRTDYRKMSTDEALRSFGPGSFDLILAFRFFANAEASLRRSIAGDLVRLLSSGGSLILNNHRNFWSTSYLARRLAGQQPLGALNRDIERIFTDEGLHVNRRFSLGIWPQGTSRSPVLPWSAVRGIERANLAWLSQRHSLGYNTVWVLSKK